MFHGHFFQRSPSSTETTTSSALLEATVDSCLRQLQKWSEFHVLRQTRLIDVFTISETMSAGDGDDFDDSSSFFSNLHVVGLVVPTIVLIFVGIIGFVVVRRNRRVRRGLSLNQQGRLALTRDVLEEVYGGNDTSQRQWQRQRQQPEQDQQHPSYTHSRRQPRTVNRWAWANNINLTTVGGSGGSSTRRREDGFNELGEAPPPYEIVTMHPKAEEDQLLHQAAAMLLPTPASTHARLGSTGNTDTAGTDYRNIQDAAEVSSHPNTTVLLMRTEQASQPPSYSPSTMVPGTRATTSDR